MRRMTLWSTAVAAALVAAGAGAGPAGADGLPVLGVDVGLTGVATADGAVRYVTLAAGQRTVVARVSQRGGRVEAARALAGAFTIPAVAYDGSAGGLSADGRTLVLIAPRASFPRARTALRVLDARRLRERATVRLRGDFSYDALSPDGATLYLIQYHRPKDPTQYRVRAYDLRSARLLPRPIVDPTEPDEQMAGSPLTRAESPDGRWAYTLYDGAGGEPFVHALDTANRSARCIDLHLLSARDVEGARLAVSRDGARLDVVRGGAPLALIDAATFRVSAPGPFQRGPLGMLAAG